MMHLARGTLLLAAVAASAACGSDDPVDAAGDYSISVTNRANGCGFDNWTEGETATAIPVTITQSGADATAVVTGGVGTWMNLVLGSNAFVGEVSGNDLELTLHGTRSYTEAGCTWTIIATLDAALDGDVLTGTLDYTTATNGSPDCGTKEGCHTLQDFNGTRPPQ